MLLEKLNDHSPVKEATITVREVVPWFTNVLDNLKIQLRCLERTANNLGNVEFWKEYKQVRGYYFKCVSWASIRKGCKGRYKLFSFVNSFV